MINFKSIIFKLIGGSGTRFEIALWWMPRNLTKDKSKFVQVMACCRQTATIAWANDDPYLYNVTRPQWIQYVL